MLTGHIDRITTLKRGDEGKEPRPEGYVIVQWSEKHELWGLEKRRTNLGSSARPLAARSDLSRRSPSMRKFCSSEKATAEVRARAADLFAV